MNKKRMKNLGKKLEEQMSLEDWATWIADRFSMCASTREYLFKAFECSDSRKSDFHRPQFVCERLGEKKDDDFEKHRDVAFECRLRAHLALEINSYLDDFLAEQSDRLILMVTEYNLYRARLEIISLSAPENSEQLHDELESNIVGVFGEYDEFAVPAVEAISEVIADLEGRMYGGNVFLTQGNRQGLARHMKQVTAFREMVGQAVEDNSPIPTEYYQKRKSLLRSRYEETWLSEARAHVRACIYGDKSDQENLMRQSLAGVKEVPMLIRNDSE
jgi:hypothetical protein